MSAWKILVKSLHAKGGGPLPRVAFDNAITSDRAIASGMRESRRLGLVVMQQLKKQWQYTLTEMGRKWCEGSVQIGQRACPVCETAEQRQVRVERLIEASHEAIDACGRLTERQRAILVLVSKGFTFVEIGQRLNLKESSARDAGHRIAVALGCTRMIEAAMVAAKAGLA